MDGKNIMNTVEQLKKRLDNLEPPQLYTKKNNRISTPERDRTDTNNQKSRHVGNISMNSNKVEQPRALSVIKSRIMIEPNEVVVDSSLS